MDSTTRDLVLEILVHSKVSNIQGVSEIKFSITGDNNMDHCEKRNVQMNMRLILNGYRQRNV